MKEDCLACVRVHDEDDYIVDNVAGIFRFFAKCQQHKYSMSICKSVILISE